MQINCENYENILIDYIDGNLSFEEKRIVDAFLLKHPDIQCEFEEIREAVVQTTSINFEYKKDLHKEFQDIQSIDDNKFEEFCIAYYEGDLNADTKRKLLDCVVQNPDFKKIFDLYAALRFQQDNNIFYSGKSELLRSIKLPVYKRFYAAASVAAVFLVGIVLYSILNPLNDPIENTSVASASKNESLAGKEKSIVATKSFEVTSHIEEQDKKPENTITSKNYLATFDTTNSKKQGKVILAKLQPRTEVLSQDQVHLSISSRNAQDIQDDLHTKQNNYVVKQVKENPKFFKPTDEMLASAVSIGVKGFNRLTESNLAFDTKTDIEGNIQRFSLRNDRFQISRKLKSQIEN